LTDKRTHYRVRNLPPFTKSTDAPTGEIITFISGASGAEKNCAEITAPKETARGKTRRGNEGRSIGSERNIAFSCRRGYDEVDEEMIKLLCAGNSTKRN